VPKRSDLKSVLVIGSGPIIIGQACEFDYSGTQACRVLREEGIRVSLVNSNPATIMTDPEFADATYVEPITQDVLEKVIARERPDAILPTLGGQTALNAGYNNGIQEGRKDRSRGDRFDYRDEGDFQRATQDFSSRLGDRELYKRYFREGFANGYEDGYRGY